MVDVSSVSSSLEEWAAVLENYERIVHDISLKPAPLRHILLDPAAFEEDATEYTRKNQDDAEDVLSKGSRQAQWPQLHETVFRQNGLIWPPVLETLYKGKHLQEVKALPARCQELVFWADKLAKDWEGSDDEEVLDLSQGILRLSRARRASPCVLPGSVLWLRRRGRRILPTEALSLQGWPLMRQHELSEWNRAQLMSLAGNAFCGQSIQAVLLALLAVYPWPTIAA